ncbi:MAG TPA: GNVR domain-containing protein [Limnochordia bacterium]
MELIEYWRIIARRKWLILLLFVTAVGSAYLASEWMRPVYEAQTTILIEEAGATLALPLLEGVPDGSSNAVQNAVEILESRSLAEATAAAVGLTLEPRSPEFSAFRERIHVRPVQGTDTIVVSVEDTDPARARDIANALVAAYIERSLDAKRTAARSAREFVEGQLRVVADELTQAEEALRRYKESEAIVAPSAQAQAVIDHIAALESGRAEAVVALEETEQQLAEIRTALASEEPTLITATTITDNPLVEGYRRRLAELEMQLAAGLESYTERHPEIVRLRAQIAEVNRELAQTAEKIVSAETVSQNPVYQGLVQQALALQVQQVATRARIDALSEQLEEAEALFSGLPEKELTLARLAREAEVSEQIYLMLREKNEEFRIQEAQETASVRVIDPAIAPTEPIKPRPKLNMAIAGFLGLFVGCGLAFLLEFLDTTLRTPQEVEQVLELPVLGQIPLVRPARAAISANGRGEAAT